MTAGRSCPLDYRYQPRDIAQAPLRPALQGLDALWVVGGLYGNLEALAALQAAFDADPAPRKALVFNGDFHWFDAEPAWFAAIQAGVERHHATRGNVETELARDALADNGCGCGYPDWVGDETVDYSNRIIQRLHAVVPDPCACSSRRCRNSCAPRWAACPSASCMATRILLAGWSFSQEALSQPETRDAARAACAEAGVQHWASSHSCLPVMQALGDGHWLLNNGAAGMPNVAGELTGLCTRIATAPLGPADAGPSAPLASVNAQGLHLSLCRIPTTPRAGHCALGQLAHHPRPNAPTAAASLPGQPICASRCCAAEGGAEQAIAVSAYAGATGLAPAGNPARQGCFGRPKTIAGHRQGRPSCPAPPRPKLARIQGRPGQSAALREALRAGSRHAARGGLRVLHPLPGPRRCG